MPVGMSVGESMLLRVLEGMGCIGVVVVVAFVVD